MQNEKDKKRKDEQEKKRTNIATNRRADAIQLSNTFSK